ncbi:(2Fe-2S)-binding protein [Nocardia spumae]|uniref:(2Fe-2S)-binding protein n=1 Tax=Nocardia spumae TaxID=2887190 RepID=UPI001D1387A5|nr:(2Fe-2S)-binding protein [Nocardia spumae]
MKMAAQPLAPGVPAGVAGTKLTEPAWLAERVADMGISWGTGVSRVSGTLWWCMAASALVDPIIEAYVAGSPVPDPTLERLRCEMRPDGGIERVVAPACGPGTAAATALGDTLRRIVPVLAEATGAGQAALWAIVADAIGNRAIDAGDPDAGARLAAEIGDRLPAPRFIDVESRTFVRRISCCLVYEVPGCQMCTSCPKRPAAERARLLADLTHRA